MRQGPPKTALAANQSVLNSDAKKLSSSIGQQKLFATGTSSANQLPLFQYALHAGKTSGSGERVPTKENHPNFFIGKMAPLVRAEVKGKEPSFAFASTNSTQAAKIKSSIQASHPGMRLALGKHIH